MHSIGRYDSTVHMSTFHHLAPDKIDQQWIHDFLLLHFFGQTRQRVCFLLFVATAPTKLPGPLKKVHIFICKQSCTHKVTRAPEHQNTTHCSDKVCHCPGQPLYTPRQSKTALRHPPDSPRKTSNTAQALPDSPQTCWIDHKQLRFQIGSLCHRFVVICIDFVHSPGSLSGKAFAAGEVFAGVGVVLQQLLRVKTFSLKHRLNYSYKYKYRNWSWSRSRAAVTAPKKFDTFVFYWLLERVKAIICMNVDWTEQQKVGIKGKAGSGGIIGLVIHSMINDTERVCWCFSQSLWGFAILFGRTMAVQVIIIM